MLGVILVQKMDYAGSLTSFRSFLERAPIDSGVDSVKKQVAEIDRYLAAKENQ